MCGICGEIRLDGSSASENAIAAMAEVLAPRGPDAAGLTAHDSVAFGHRRLSIIDLSPQGRQPMHDPALGLTLVFNGCIYNHKELRGELEARGHRFFSTSDSEVILKAYATWGARCVERFQGMFAFAVHERDSGRVTLARDRLGIKPLYYAKTSRFVRFASALPALVAAGGIDTEIDAIALHHYMSFHSVVPAPRTILKGVRKLPPATIAVLEPDGSWHEEGYWRLDFTRDRADETRDAEEWQDLVLAALRTAVERRLVADVPVGVLLSGGVDSSLIVGLLAELSPDRFKTFSVGFSAVGGEEGDEFRYSDLIVQRFGTDHEKIFVPTERVLDALPGAIHAMSEPMVSHDVVAFYLLSREVARHVKVVQSGQGADEVFGGYHWYPPMLEGGDALDTYRRHFFDRDHGEMGRVLDPRLLDGDASLDFVREHFAVGGAEDPADKALRLDTTVMLVDDPVKRVDNMTMAFGLEARVPFLDHELVELAARIPPELKLRDGGKWVLKEVARRVIPAEVIDRPKGYFPLPALKYLQGPYLEMVKDALSSRAARERRLFQPAYVEMLFEQPEAHITPLRGSKLWQLGLLELWLQSHGI